MTTGSYSLGVGTDLERQKSWSGVDNKNADNPYSSDLSRRVNQKATKWERYGAPPYWRYASGQDSYIVNSNGQYLSTDSSQDLKCLAKISDQIRGHSFNAGVFLAELPESIATVVNSTRAVLGAATSVYRGDIAGATRNLGRILGQTEKRHIRRKIDTGDMSGAWLALRYGWQPMLNDIFELMKFIESKNKRRTLVYHSTSSKFDTANVSVVPKMYSLVAHRQATVRYKVTLSEHMSMARTLGLLAPWSVIWEKIPFSFVWDWFMPIGSYLDSLSLFQGFDAQMCKTTYCRAEAQRSASVIYNGPSVRYETGYFSWLRIVTSRRTGPLVVPKPDWKTLDKAFSVGHLQNASALIHQMVRSRPF